MPDDPNVVEKFTGKATNLVGWAGKKVGLKKEELKRQKIEDSYHLEKKQVVDYLEKKFPKNAKEIGEMQEINEKFYVMLPRFLTDDEVSEIAKLRRNTGALQPDAEGNLPFPFAT